MKRTDESIRVAVAQIAPSLGDIAANVEKHLQYALQARDAGADIVVFPELSLTGYNLGESTAAHARRLDDPVFRPLGELSEQVGILAGFVELAFAAQLHNSCLLFWGGRPAFIHRKLNLPNYGRLEEGKHFAAGRYLETHALRSPWELGVLVCSDFWNPALVHLAAVKGAVLLAAPINSALATVSQDFSNPAEWDLTLQFYSKMYGMPIALANRVGSEGEFKFWGRSRIIGPRGNCIAEAGEDGEELIVAELAYGEVVAARSRLPTVRDSNLDLIHREIHRLRNSIGYPSIVVDD